jgi:hypothetical protein
MPDKPLTLAEARQAIEAIMDRIPQKALPKISRVEPATDKYGPCVWFDARSHGFHIGSGKKNGEPHPIDWHRSTAITDLFDREAALRYEAKWWEDLAELAAAFAPESVEVSA